MRGATVHIQERACRGPGTRGKTNRVRLLNVPPIVKAYPMGVLERYSPKWHTTPAARMRRWLAKVVLAPVAVHGAVLVATMDSPHHVVSVEPHAPSVWRAKTWPKIRTVGPR